MTTKKFMIADEDDGFYDIYFFEEEVEVENLKTVISIAKKKIDWTLEDIETAIKGCFNVKYKTGFDWGNGDMVEIKEV